MPRTRSRTCTAVVSLATALTIAACHPALVRENRALSQRVAADSAAAAQLVQQIAALRQRCRADSIRLAAERAGAPPVSSTPVPSAADSLLRAREAEIASLRDQLARANAELERIKRRLASPRI